ncbi:hypothetical protein [Bartonella tamiae]|uniref:Uncharacterized protein n=1 Tax=Bartonella tamiae Th239 TaxID=1094558 RepID=J1JVB5_9HYPH|nr:hypothetical protein [Bartonella tamiae]EJF88892.1 hypothetical protein ME5_01443 [Bartonella tamiae Th239]EJF94858.1 hypothetical protein MEG_00439 [Bartonella tamiae Th307]
MKYALRVTTIIAVFALSALSTSFAHRNHLIDDNYSIFEIRQTIPPKVQFSLNNEKIDRESSIIFKEETSIDFFVVSET